MWTLAERTTIQALFKREIPISLIVHILMKNRRDGWMKVKKQVKIIGILAFCKYYGYFRYYYEWPILWHLQGRTQYQRSRGRYKIRHFRLMLGLVLCGRAAELGKLYVHHPQLVM
jgi:hypothetical protein